LRSSRTSSAKRARLLMASRVSIGSSFREVSENPRHGVPIVLQQQLFSRSLSCSPTRNCVGSSWAGQGWAAAVRSPGSLFSRRKRCAFANHCCCRNSNGEKNQRSSGQGATRPSARTARIPGFRVLDNRSRMGLLESGSPSRVSRGSDAGNSGLRTKFVVFFSVAIGTPKHGVPGCLTTVIYLLVRGRPNSHVTRGHLKELLGKQRL